MHTIIHAQVSCSSLSFLKVSDHAASQSAPSHTIANGLACISLSPTVRLAMLAEVIYIEIHTYMDDGCINRSISVLHDGCINRSSMSEVKRLPLGDLGGQKKKKQPKYIRCFFLHVRPCAPHVLAERYEHHQTQQSPQGILQPDLVISSLQDSHVKAS